MPSFNNVPIISKFLSILGLFAIFVIGSVTFATEKMRAIDSGYQTADTHGTAYALAMLRANRRFSGVRAATSDLMLAQTAGQTKKAYDEIKASRDAMLGFFEDAKKTYPEKTPVVENFIKMTLQVIDKTCAPAIDMAAKAKNVDDTLAAQREYLSACGPKFAEPSAALVKDSQDIRAIIEATTPELARTTASTILITYGVTLVGLIITFVLSYIALRAWVSNPIRQLVGTMGRLANNDLNVEIAGTERRDEIGLMASAVQVFKDQGLRLIQTEVTAADVRKLSEAERASVERQRQIAAENQSKVLRSIAEGLEKLSDGDLVFRLSDPFAEEYEQLRTDFNAAIEKLQNAMSVVSSNTFAIQSNSVEISRSADDLSRRTEQQAASLAETAAALNDITTTVRRTADGALNAQEFVTKVRGTAADSSAIVNSAVDAMGDIEKSSQHIGQIIGVIDEIAFQTNLLALNAGVEAARAGDAGRGFAVVAQEVRALAQRSADAAKEIKALISTSRTQVEQGVDLVGRTGAALDQIVSQVNEINAIVGEIAISAQAQATGLQQVSTAVNEMDSVIQQNAAMVEESTAASHSLASDADELSALMGRFKVSEAATRSASAANGGSGPARQRAPAIKSEQVSPAGRSGRIVATAGRAALARKPIAQTDAESWRDF